MKPFVLAIVSLLLTVTVVTVNGICTTRVCEQLLEKVEAAPQIVGESMDEQAAHFQSLNEKWDSDKKLISMSVNHGVIEEIDGYLAAIEGACKSNDIGSYEVNKEKMAAALENLRGLATVNIENII